MKSRFDCEFAKAVGLISEKQYDDESSLNKLTLKRELINEFMENGTLKPMGTSSGVLFAIVRPEGGVFDPDRGVHYTFTNDHVVTAVITPMLITLLNGYLCYSFHGT